MFQACHAHHQEKTNCINTANGNCHSVLVAVTCADWDWPIPICTRHSHQHRVTITISCIDTICFS